jgi:hypothetical protein
MMEYQQLGHNMYKIASESKANEWYYISKHQCPFREYPDPESKEEAEEGFKEYHWVCSCRSYTIGIPSKNENPLEGGCKHLVALWKQLVITYL